MKENPRYKNLYFNQAFEAPIATQRRTMVSAVYESPILSKRRAKNKVARKARKVNKKNRRK